MRLSVNYYFLVNVSSFKVIFGYDNPWFGVGHKITLNLENSNLMGNQLFTSMCTQYNHIDKEAEWGLKVVLQKLNCMILSKSDSVYFVRLCEHIARPGPSQDLWRPQVNLSWWLSGLLLSRTKKALRKKGHVKAKNEVKMRKKGFPNLKWNAYFFYLRK